MPTKKVKYEVDFAVGDTVYLITDPAQYKRQVVEIRLGVEPKISYVVRMADYEPTEHLPFELSAEITQESIREEPEE